ncbi:MAG: DUF1573 domain-containing protein [Prevotella sp.]|nr:DUF1573 domain-containing protein [Prevotella sp.]
MRPLRILSSLIFSASLLNANAQCFTANAKEFECGQMMFRTPATITVTLRNTSTQPAEIKYVDTGCGCSKATYPAGAVNPGLDAQVSITFDCKQLGHFDRIVRVYDKQSERPAEFEVRGQVVTKIENYTGNYPFKLGNLLTDVEAIDFDDVHKGVKMVKEIHIMNPTGQNVEPVMLRLPSYLSAEMLPKTLGPKQKGTMCVTLNSRDLRDYGLTQSTIYLGKNSTDKVNKDKEVTVSTVLLPPVLGKDDLKRAYAPKLVMSAKSLNMTELQTKSKAHDEITISNEGKSTLEISKLQLFTAGLQVQLGQQRLEPGETTKLKVTAIGKELKKVRTRPRILMITNDPNNQKIVINIQK